MPCPGQSRLAGGGRWPRKSSGQPRELEDGYEFTFPKSVEWADRLIGFVVFERVCCPFFTCEIFFEPDTGSIVLKIREPESVKEFVEELVDLQPG